MRNGLVAGILLALCTFALPAKAVSYSLDFSGPSLGGEYGGNGFVSYNVSTGPGLIPGSASSYFDSCYFPCYSPGYTVYYGIMVGSPLGYLGPNLAMNADAARLQGTPCDPTRTHRSTKFVQLDRKHRLRKLIRIHNIFRNRRIFFTFVSVQN